MKNKALYLKKKKKNKTETKTEWNYTMMHKTYHKKEQTELL